MLGNVEGPAKAANAYESVIALALQLDRQDIAGDAFHNAATQHVELRDFDRASIYYAEALARHDATGNTVGRAITEWGLARLIVLHGDLDRGSTALGAARRRLLGLGLAQYHAYATLDWSAARLALGNPEGVADACREILVRYESEGANRNAKLALAYLHEALRQGRATPKLMQNLRDYLMLLSRNPTADFRPAT